MKNLRQRIRSMDTGRTSRFGRGKPRKQKSTILITRLTTPLGPLVAGATNEGICLLEFGEPVQLTAQLGSLRTAFNSNVARGENQHLRKLRTELADYFVGCREVFSVPVVTRGTLFQRSVWRALTRIPYGATCSYEDVAQRIGRFGAQRAVGQANSCNRIVILIPCHRVVSKHDGVGGYSSGLWRKQRLLELEQRGFAARGNAAIRTLQRRASR